MKKWILSALMMAIFPALAADFVAHNTGKAVEKPRDADVHVFNFWATYCVPCRKEMPEMSRWYQKARKGKNPTVELVGIALDSRENVAQFLRTTPVKYPIWRYEGQNSRALMRDYGNKIGALPYTVVRARCGSERVIVGEVDAMKLNQAVAAVWQACQKSAG